nr:hypothetical protein [Tanacetum cinerariifolium]
VFRNRAAHSDVAVTTIVKNKEGGQNYDCDSQPYIKKSQLALSNTVNSIRLVDDLNMCLVYYFNFYIYVTGFNLTLDTLEREIYYSSQTAAGTLRKPDTSRLKKEILMHDFDNEKESLKIIEKTAKVTLNEKITNDSLRQELLSRENDTNEFNLQLERLCNKKGESIRRLQFIRATAEQLELYDG